MIYLDYSATTPVKEEVLDTYVKVSHRYIGNPNSLHKLGTEAKKIIDEATLQIKNVLKTDKEVIYTSGASEANNLAIFGISKKYKNRGNHIITTHLEHSSVTEALKNLEKDGYKISYAPITKTGQINLEKFEKLITEKTILVSICAVNSETGVEQDLDAIGKIIKKYPKVIFHSDVTQIIGKKRVNFDNVDLISMSSQKFYGMKGIGCLLKNKNIELEPIIYGGKSTTVYRSGTPATPLIISLSKALRLAYTNIDEEYNYVKELSDYTKEKLNNIDTVTINSTTKSIPHIINISTERIKPETLLHALEEEDIYISTKTACSKTDNLSESVFELTKDKQKASHSLRISLSYLTTKEEIDKFIKVLKEKITYLLELEIKN
ncbi:MAG: cysteine desulfurase [Bacilli bacterium]|nr:cysteine desulfurase [Bacilli bacterium]